MSRVTPELAGTVINNQVETCGQHRGNQDYGS
jgi:hypothetical protein